MNISTDVNYNKKILKAILGSDDIVFFDFELGKTSALCVYVDSITDKELLGLEVLAPLKKLCSEKSAAKTNISHLAKTITLANVKTESKITDATNDILSGFAMIFIDGISRPEIIDKIRQKIQEIDIDGIPDSSYVSKLLNERKTSLFKQVGSTERPDVLIERMLEGRAGIIVDGSPFALTLPYLLIEDFQAAEDYYISQYRANLVRALRVIAMIFSILLPSVFVAAQLFHLQIIPLNFLLTIVNGIKEIPFSPSLEMFFVLLIFELLNETSVRMPKYVGMALAVVGALVLGETAVNAGIVSTPAILIMALSGISIYAIPELVETTSVLRFIYLIVAGSLGGYGLILITAFLIIYLCSADNYGAPYLAPYSPVLLNDFQDGLYMNNVIGMVKRPEALGAKNKTRQKIK